MTTYTYLADEDCYLTEDGVHISNEAKAAIDSFEKVGTKSQSGSKWKSTLKDKEIKILSSDVVEYDNAFSVKTSTLTDGSVFEILKYHSLIVANDQNNIIHGNDGNHTWSGRDDFIFAGRGHDIVYGYSGDDTLYGEQGDDVLNGGHGTDSLFGGVGDDVLYGGAGDDRLFGGDGSDWLFSGPVDEGASDKLYGGTGADAFVIGEIAGDETNVTGMDWSALALSLAGDVTDLAVTAYQPGYKMKLVKEVIPMVFDVIKGVGAMSKETISAPKAAYVTIEDFNPLEDVVIIPLNKSGNANIFLSADNNTANALTIKSDTGTSTDIIATLAFDEAHAIFGDEFTSMNANAQQAFVDALMQSALIVDSDGVSLGMQNGTKVDVDASLLEGFGANQYLIFGAYSGYGLEGSAAADILFGTNHGDVLSGYNPDPMSGTAFAPELAGDDELYGFGGDDIFFGGGGNNHLFGGEGSDTASYIHANRGIAVDMNATQADANGTYVQLANGHARLEYIGGQATEIIGTDKLYGIENIVGSEHDDVIIGDDGDNALATGKGDDVLTGGSGADSFLISGGSNTVRDYARKEGDTIIVDAEAYDIRYHEEIATSWDGDTVSLYVDSQDDPILVINGQDKASFDVGIDVELQASLSWLMNGFEPLFGQEMILGSGADDTLRAAETGSALVGGSGSDTLIGRGGEDTFVINGGTDNLILNYEFLTSKYKTEKIFIDAKYYGIKSLDHVQLGSEFDWDSSDTSQGMGFNLYIESYSDNPIVTVQSPQWSHPSMVSLELYNL